MNARTVAVLWLDMLLPGGGQARARDNARQALVEDQLRAADRRAAEDALAELEPAC